MNGQKHEDIKKRAYELWEAAGRPLGKADDHWLQAEAEIKKALDGVTKKKPAARKSKTTKKAAPKTAAKAKPKTTRKPRATTKKKKAE